MASTKPFVSVVTPTYNRRKFIPTLIDIYTAQTYPKDRMEWIILDDGADKVGDLITSLTKHIPNVRYIALDTKTNIGAKRNILNKEAKGDIIICMDDDDYYLPERITYTVSMFIRNPKVELAGCSEIYMYYTDIGEIYKFGPYSATHATNGTLAFRRSYLKTHSHDESVTHAEEKSFLDGFQNPIIQLDCHKIMLVMSHSENTFDKIKFRDKLSPFVKKTEMKIKYFIKDKSIRDFFTSA